MYENFLARKKILYRSQFQVKIYKKIQEYYLHIVSNVM